MRRDVQNLYLPRGELTRRAEPAGVCPIVGLRVPKGNCNESFTVEWDQQQRFLLTRTSVICNAPEESGVYGLYSPEQCVYIGHTSNIQKALLDYLSGRRPYVLQWQPNYFVFECLHYKERSARNKELVARYQPVGNRLHRFK